MQRDDIGRALLLLGLAFIFIYFGVDKFLHPLVWIGWMPPMLDGLLGLSVNGWLKIAGIAELLLGLMVLIPIRAFKQVGFALMAMHLLAVLTQTGWNDIAVRDIGLLAMTIAAFLLH